MQLHNSQQYQNINGLDTAIIRGYKYQKSRNTDDFYFDNIADWGLNVAPQIAVPNTNLGLVTFSGINTNSLGVQTIQNYNPLSVMSQEVTKPVRLTAVNQGGTKVVKKDYKNQTNWLMKLRNVAGAGNVVTLRFYTGTTDTAYYQVVLTLPAAATDYTFKFNPFLAGTYGSVGTPVTINGQLVNSGQAVVTAVGTPTGTFVDRISYFASTLTAGNEALPVFLQAGNNQFQLLGQSFAIPMCCLKDVTKELERTYQDLKCGKDKSGKVIDEQTLDITFSTSKRMELLLALSYTTELNEETLRITAAKQILTLSGGTLTLSGAVNVANFAGISLGDTFGCVGLQRDYVNNTATTLDPNFYYLNETTGVVTFSNQMTATEVEVYNYTDKLVRVIDLYTTLNPIRVVLELQQKSTSGVQTDGGLYLIDLGVGKPTNDDEGNTYEFVNSVVLDGYRKAIQFTY